MNHVLSTHLFVNHRLTTFWLEKIWQAGVPAVEIFCARQHLDYRDKAQITELGHWFRDSELKLHSLHSPMYSDELWGRTGPNSHITITEPVKSKRLIMLDEIKRALDIADTIPFRYLIQHLGVSEEEFDERKIDAAFSSLEEINLFARERGVDVLLENIPNQLASAERLVYFLERTHLKLNFCLDVGHANMNEGVANAFKTLKGRIHSTHLHDNDGKQDSHLWPFFSEGGTIDWKETMRLLRTGGDDYPLLLELREMPEYPLPQSLDMVARIFEKLEELLMEAVRIRIEDAARHVGEPVEIAGWLYNLRKSGKIVFPLLRDGTGILQSVAVKANLPEALFEELKNLTQESSLIVRGKLRAEPRAAGGVEMDIEEAEIVQRVPESDPYPITPKEHGTDFLMDHRHLWLRSKRQHAVIRVRHEVIKAIRDYFDSHGFTLVDTPIFTPAACEGTTTLFEVNYFDEEKVYLTQSGQLYNEADAMAFGKVYCFGPTFRAEKSKTRRHLTEFWMVEPEMAYATLEDVKRVAEEFIVYVVERVLENRRPELEALERDISKLESVKAPFSRISYDQAVVELQKKGSEIQWGGDFGGTDETLITEGLDRPLIVDRYPSQIKAFYFQPDPERPELALGVDVIAPEGYGEIIGGGQRIHDLRLLLQRLDEHHLPREAFEWYLDLRKFGSVPHGGFGMGVERFVAWMCGLEHIRETIAFPRMLYRTRP